MQPVRSFAISTILPVTSFKHLCDATQEFIRDEGVRIGRRDVATEEMRDPIRANIRRFLAAFVRAVRHEYTSHLITKTDALVVSPEQFITEALIRTFPEAVNNSTESWLKEHWDYDHGFSRCDDLDVPVITHILRQVEHYLLNYLSGIDFYGGVVRNAKPSILLADENAAFTSGFPAVGYMVQDRINFYVERDSFSPDYNSFHRDISTLRSALKAGYDREYHGSYNAYVLRAIILNLPDVLSFNMMFILKLMKQPDFTEINKDALKFIERIAVEYVDYACFRGVHEKNQAA